MSPVSVIIVNHNAGSLLTLCVHTALQQARHVIIVDNASSDSSLTELMTRFPDERRLQLIHVGHNAGFAAGCNIGLIKSTQPYVLFLNPDCVLEVNALKRLVHALETDPLAGMVGGRLTNSDGTEQGGGRRAIH